MSVFSVSIYLYYALRNVLSTLSYRGYKEFKLYIYIYIYIYSAKECSYFFACISSDTV